MGGSPWPFLYKGDFDWFRCHADLKAENSRLTTRPGGPAFPRHIGYQPYRDVRQWPPPLRRDPHCCSRSAVPKWRWRQSAARRRQPCSRRAHPARRRLSLGSVRHVGGRVAMERLPRELRLEEVRSSRVKATQAHRRRREERGRFPRFLIAMDDTTRGTPQAAVPFSALRRCACRRMHRRCTVPNCEGSRTEHRAPKTGGRP